MNYTEKISNKLSRLLVKNKEAKKGYLNAIDNVDDERLQMFFKRRVSQHSEFAKELRKHILRYGYMPEDLEGYKGMQHRDWETLKMLFVTDNEKAVLNETIKGEKANLDEYNEILKKQNLPESTRSLLKKHKKAIEFSINTERSYTELVS